MKVVLDHSGCIGCGLCVETCPEVFRMADDGLAEVHEQPGEAELDAVKEAEEGCPVSVIHADD